MRKVLLIIAILLPFCGMAQTKYCLLTQRTSDDLERTDYMYGNDNELISYERYDGVDQNDVVRLRDTLLYDAEGNCVKIKNYQFIDNVWRYTWYVDYEYDANHNRTARENYNSFDNGVTFDLGGRYEYTYDENNRIVSYVMYFVGSEFEHATYTYNEDGLLIEQYIEMNDPWGGTGWSPTSRVNYTYNSDNICTRISYYDYNGGWNNTRNDVFTIDEYGNVSIEEIYSANFLVSRYSYEFDHGTTMENVIYPIDPESDYDWSKFATRPLGYGWETADQSGTMQYVCDFLFEYCEVYDGVNQLIAENEMLQIYPNPTEGTTTIQMKGLEKVVVMDMNGNIVIDQAASTSQIDLSGMASGLYIVKAFNGQKWHFGKVQVK
ncbi:MAG: T9SS type A sorting domain-containing protein [Bacteroidales bacterium]|nr:T9SS type A sorting domain-containing protein [Bacteroidales bacterium]